MSSYNNLSVEQFRKAAAIKEKIEALENELNKLLGSPSESVADKTPKSRKKGGMSAAGRARVAAAQKARWAKVRAGKPASEAVKLAKPAKKKSTMSVAGRARIAAAQKVRWAKVKAAKK